MIRWAAGAASALALVLALFFVWKSRAQAHDPIPAAPAAVASSAASGDEEDGQEAAPPSASAKSKEEKRFARADHDKNGRIVLAELLAPRRKAFDKLDA